VGSVANHAAMLSTGRSIAPRDERQGLDAYTRPAQTSIASSTSSRRISRQKGIQKLWAVSGHSGRFAGCANRRKYLINKGWRRKRPGGLTGLQNRLGRYCACRRVRLPPPSAGDSIARPAAPRHAPNRARRSAGQRRRGNRRRGGDLDFVAAGAGTGGKCPITFRFPVKRRASAGPRRSSRLNSHSLRQNGCRPTD